MAKPRASKPRATPYKATHAISSTGNIPRVAIFLLIGILTLVIAIFAGFYKGTGTFCLIMYIIAAFSFGVGISCWYCGSRCPAPVMSVPVQ